LTSFVKNGGEDRLLPPLSVFENCLAAKLWFSQATHALCVPVSQSLISALITDASTYLVLDFADTVKQLRDKHDTEVGPPTDAITTLLENSRPIDIYTSVEADGIVEVDAARQESNENARARVNECLTECLQHTSLLSGCLLALYVRRNEHYALSRGSSMLSAPEKSLLYEEVQEILEYLEVLTLTDFTVYTKLKVIFTEQETWRTKISRLVAGEQPTLEKLTLEMRAYRNREQSGIALVQTRMLELKRLFALKPTCEDMVAVLEEDASQ